MNFHTSLFKSLLMFMNFNTSLLKSLIIFMNSNISLLKSLHFFFYAFQHLPTKITTYFHECQHLSLKSLLPTYIYIYIIIIPCSKGWSRSQLIESANPRAFSRVSVIAERELNFRKRPSQNTALQLTMCHKPNAFDYLFSWISTPPY